MGCDEVIGLLVAEIEDIEQLDGTKLSIVRFKDRLMRFEVYITEAQDGVFIAADVESPIQGLPFFETSVPCKLVAPFPRIGMPTGLGFYDGEVGSDTIRFSITRREDGCISLSGAYP